MAGVLERGGDVMDSLMTLCGMQIIVSDLLPTTGADVWTRRPRSKKSRIRQKWMKNPANWKKGDAIDAVMFGGHNAVVLTRSVMKRIEDDLVRNAMVPRDIAWMNDSKEPTKAEIMATIGEFPKADFDKATP